MWIPISKFYNCTLSIILIFLPKYILFHFFFVFSIPWLIETSLSPHTSIVYQQNPHLQHYPYRLSSSKCSKCQLRAICQPITAENVPSTSLATSYGYFYPFLRLLSAPNRPILLLLVHQQFSPYPFLSCIDILEINILLMSCRSLGRRKMDLRNLFYAVAWLYTFFCAAVRMLLRYWKTRDRVVDKIISLGQTEHHCLLR